jgi:hypothetical protein
LANLRVHDVPAELAADAAAYVDAVARSMKAAGGVVKFSV